MAFTLQTWARASVSANEPLETLASGAYIGSFRNYSYSSPTDSQATIVNTASPGYFSAVAYDLATGDLITVYSILENSYVTYEVTNTAGVITLLATGAAQLSLTMTAAQFIAAYAAPQILLPAPGAGLMYVVDRTVMNLVYGTVQYTSGGVAAVQYGSTVHGAGVLVDAGFAAADFTGPTVNNIATAQGVLALQASSGTVNKGLYWSNQTAAFATGDSPITINVFYHLIKAL